MFIAHARSIKRIMLATNIIETKLIAIRFKPCNKLHKLFKYFVFSELDLVCLTMMNERRQNTSFLVSIRLYGSKQS